MYPYIFIYILIALAAIFEFNKAKFYQSYKNFFSFISFFILFIFMSFKYYVGGDWGTYFGYFTTIENANFNIKDLNHDIGFYLLNLFFSKINAPFYFINIFSSFISLIGIFFLAKKFDHLLLFILILLPYFIFIVLMGYTRQSIAIGFCYIAISYLLKPINIKILFLYLFLISIAFLFHKSAVIFFVIPFLYIKINYYNFFILALSCFIFSVFLLYVFFNDYLLYRLNYFLENNYSSFGAYIRVSILFLVSFFNFVVIRNFSFGNQIRKLNDISLFFIFVISSLIFISPSSVIVDRFLLYFYYIIPITIMLLIDNSKNYVNKKIIMYCVTLIGLVFILLWFNFASNSFSWIPYRFYPIF